MKQALWGGMAAMAVVGCGPADNVEPVTDVGLATEAITHSQSYTENWSGVVALKVYAPSLLSWATECSGALMTNDKLISAGHCFPDPTGKDPLGRQIYAQMGAQVRMVVKTVRFAGADVAVAKLVSPMEMPNWSNGAYLTTPYQKTFAGYARAAYSGTNASLNNSALLCMGYGGAQDTLGGMNEPPLTAAVFPTTFGTSPRPDAVHLLPTATNQRVQEGDSGGPCLSGFSSFGSPLAAVIFGDTSNMDFAAGAESWAGWAFYTLLTI